MANFEPKKIVLQNINNGQRYVKNDEPDEETFNAPIESSAYAQELAEYAKKVVDELKDNIVEKQGTIVKFGGVSQNQVDFDSNPQVQLDELKSRPTAEAYEVIYDYSSDNPEINLGYPNGIVGGTTLNYDFTKWSKIKVYVIFNWNTIGITECDLNSVVADYVSDYMDEDRRYSIALLTETSKALFSMRLRLPKDKQSLIFETIGYISGTVWSERNNSTEMVRNNIYKIEGLK